LLKRIPLKSTILSASFQLANCLNGLDSNLIIHLIATCRHEQMAWAFLLFMQRMHDVRFL
jgi:hypothetical protein